MADADQRATDPVTDPVTNVRVLVWWALRPDPPKEVDTVAWVEGSTTLDFRTGIAHEQFYAAVRRYHGVPEAFAMLAGWSNGYVAIFPPREAPWETDSMSDPPA